MRNKKIKRNGVLAISNVISSDNIHQIFEFANLLKVLEFINLNLNKESKKRMSYGFGWSLPKFNW
jgi:hypothetical protein